MFFALTVLSFAVGGSIGYACWIFGVLTAADRAISVIPGGMSDLMRPGFHDALGADRGLCRNSLVDRASCAAARVAQVERDLPVTLELLATLAEAGLGFDAALDRILTSQPSERALVQEFRTFQAEVLAGRPRSIACGGFHAGST